jgi:PTS HPr component phosphorylation site.
LITTTIVLAGADDVKEFVAAMSRHNYAATLLSGPYCIDPKSLIGVFSLDFSSPATLQIDAPQADDLLREIGRFIVPAPSQMK